MIHFVQYLTASADALYAFGANLLIEAGRHWC